MGDLAYIPATIAQLLFAPVAGLVVASIAYDLIRQLR